MISYDIFYMQIYFNINALEVILPDGREVSQYKDTTLHRSHHYKVKEVYINAFTRFKLPIYSNVKQGSIYDLFSAFW